MAAMARIPEQIALLNDTRELIEQSRRAIDESWALLRHVGRSEGDLRVAVTAFRKAMAELTETIARNDALDTEDSQDTADH